MTDRTAIEYLADKIDATISRGSKIHVLSGAELYWVVEAIRENAKYRALGEKANPDDRA